MKIKIDLADNFIDVWNEEKEIWERYVKVKLEEEKKIPEKLGYQDNADGTFYLNHKKYNSEPIKILSRKINEIIDYLDYLKSKGDE